jgi:hypothetical protein
LKKADEQMTQENTVQKNSNMKVIALAVICVILAASLVGVIAVYVPNNSQALLTERENTIASLQTQINALEYQLSNINTTTYVTQIAYLNSQLSDLNYTLTSVYSDYVSLQKIVQLATSEVWYDNSFSQDGNATTTLGSAQVDYAGYLVVQATDSANSTYAEVLYTFAGINLNFNQTVGTTGTALFPLLPGIVEVRMGNINQSSVNNVTAKITHYY